jgi:hypothetical protein
VDLEDRRKRVLNLRLRQMSLSAIASAVEVDEATVSRDIAWIHKNWRDTLGRSPTIDLSEIIGESMAFYSELERLLLHEHAKLNALNTTPAVSKARALVLEAASRQRERRNNLLVSFGVFDRAADVIRSSTKTIPRAADMRRLITGAVVTDDMLTPQIERDRMEGVDVIDVTPLE